MAAETALSKRGKDMAKVIMAWEALVPEALATKCWPHKIKCHEVNGVRVNVLQVHAQDSHTGLAITYCEPVLLEKMLLYFGRKIVDKILTKTVGSTSDGPK
jgi:hypothetical protein